MSITKYIRDVQSRFQAIPGPAAIFYDLLPARILKKPENKIVNDIVKKINGGVVVDLGSGVGYLSIEIASRIPGTQVCGIDLSRQMVKIAKRHARGIENVQFKFGDAADLPFDNDSVDFVVSTASLHHWKSPVEIFNECYRVLRNGKEAWIYDPCCDALINDADKAKKEYGPMLYRILKKVTELHGFTRQEYGTRIKGFLDQTGFKNNYQMELTDIWMKTVLKKDEQNLQSTNL